MTREQDMDRVLDQWFAEGPTQMPSRFLDDTLDRLNRAPQRRLAGVRPRLLAMSPSLRLAVAAAVVLLVAGTALAVVSRAPAVGVSPSPAPTAVPSASSQAVADPTAIETKWTSVGTRVDPSEPNAYSVTTIFGASSISLPGFKEDLLNSWSLVAPGRVEFRVLATSTFWRCQSGDIGTYAIGLSSASQILTLTPVSEVCATRGAFLAGDWTRWPCPNPKSTCGPELSPGRHTTPFVPSADPGQPSFPPKFLTTYSYTVPAGWSQTDSSALGRPNDPFSMAITLIPDVAPHSQASDCRDAVEPGVDSTPTALAKWLARIPGLVTTTPVPVEIGGSKGLMLDVFVASTWRIACQQFFAGPVRAVFTFTQPVPDPGGAMYIREYLQDDAYARYILLDIGAGHNLLVEVTAPDQASWNEFTRAAMPIVNSFEFVR